jgi:undecaprenyl pyrophosphate phosphatase UppP
MTFDLFKAFVLGVVEGLTEFLPVSSTGHLLLVQPFFGFDDDDFGKTFAVLIQFGAILALLSIYFVRLWNLALGFFTDPAARRFVIGVLVAFLPAAIVGALPRLHQERAVQRLDRLSPSSSAAPCCSGSTAWRSIRATMTPPSSRCRCISSSAWRNAYR